MGKRERPASAQMRSSAKYSQAMRELQREVEVVAAAREALLHDLREACEADDLSAVVRLARKLTGLDE